MTAACLGVAFLAACGGERVAATDPEVIRRAEATFKRAIESSTTGRVQVTVVGQPRCRPVSAVRLTCVARARGVYLGVSTATQDLRLDRDTGKLTFVPYDR